jgi:hypothetical protein
MMMRRTIDARKPIVFLGPSAPKEQIKAILPQAAFQPPIARDQLYEARERGGAIFLIIDGIFAHDLAVSPREVVDVLRDGALIYGASSMGALRAAECWPAGMRGVGAISRLYKLGYLETDDEVAVATNADRDYAPVSVALVNARYAASRAVKRKLISRQSASEIIRAAKEIFFADRTWARILKRAGVADSDGSLKSFCASNDLKNKDALRAARALASRLEREPDIWARHNRENRAPFARPERYTGHDALLGFEEGVLHCELARWLIGSGRYQKYIWPLVIGEPEFRGLGRIRSFDRRAESLRERLAATLARFCSDIGSFAPKMAAELDFLEELEAEIMRWHSALKVSEEARKRGLSADKNLSARTREELAIAHGLRDWQMLSEEAQNGLLFDAIPLKWIEDACSNISLARTFRTLWHSEIETGIESRIN